MPWPFCVVQKNNRWELATQPTTGQSCPSPDCSPTTPRGSPCSFPLNDETIGTKIISDLNDTNLGNWCRSTVGQQDFYKATILNISPESPSPCPLNSDCYQLAQETVDGVQRIYTGTNVCSWMESAPDSQNPNLKYLRNQEANHHLLH